MGLGLRFDGGEGASHKLLPGGSLPVVFCEGLLPCKEGIINVLRREIFCGADDGIQVAGAVHAAEGIDDFYGWFRHAATTRGGGEGGIPCTTRDVREGQG
jgi:hypothetical protein